MVEVFLQANPEDKLFNEYEVRLILNKAIEQTKEKVRQEYEQVEKQLRAEQFANFSSTREVLNPSQNTSYSYIM